MLMASLILPVIHAPLQLMVVGVPGQTGLHVSLYSMEIRKGKEAGNVTILNLQMEEVTALETQKKLKIVLLMVIGVTGQAGVAAV